MYKLVIQDDEGKTTVVPLIRDELTIGRKEGNTIRLTERNVSRAHARLTRSNGTVVIEDLNSYNGIRVNGSRIQGRATIAETDRVQIGDYLIEIRSASAEANAADETQPLDRVKAAAAVQEQETKQLPISDAKGPLPMGAMTPEVVALADTDPGRTASSISAHARLVVLSTNFPGQEFVLEKPAMVVGRTDENDIWLNHRSISRHHAKVVLENGRYSIEDLQSSNGVRVNGEEYGKVELRRADVIDLGHVRLRFVEPGEDFVFGRDAQPVEVFPEGGNRTLLYVGAIGALLVGIVAVFMLATGGGGDKQGEGEGSGTSAGTGKEGSGAGTAVAAVMDAAPVAEVPADAAADVAVTDTVKLKAHIDAAKTELAAKRWAKALEQATLAEAIDPKSAEAKALADKARAELRADEAMSGLSDASKRGDYKQVLEFADQLSGTTRQAEAARIVARAETSEWNAAKNGLTRLARANNCDELAREARGLRFPANRSKAKSIACEATEDPGSGSGTGSGTATVNTAALDAKIANIGSLIRDAPAQALKVCDEAQAAGKFSGLAQKCALAACGAGIASRGKRYRNMLGSEKERDTVTLLCKGKGVVLD